MHRADILNGDGLSLVSIAHLKNFQTLTLSSPFIVSCACSRDMTGLSNQALSTALKSPLLMLLEALPIGAVGEPGSRRRIRSAGTTLPCKAVKVILTVPISVG